MRKAEKVYLGKSTGLPNQTFKIKKYQSIIGRLQLETNIEGFIELWEEVDSLDASGPEDRFYMLDKATGEIRFGDGTHGKIPSAGADISAKYRSGEGGYGNVTFTGLAS